MNACLTMTQTVRYSSLLKKVLAFLKPIKRSIMIKEDDDKVKESLLFHAHQAPITFFSTFIDIVKCVKTTMQNRDRTEIIRQILDASNGYGDATKTKLVSKVSLNSMQLKEYVKLLTENELLCYDLATYTFKTTQKGLKFLYLCNKIDELMMEKEEEQVEVHKERLGFTNTTRQTDCWQSLKL